MSASYTSAIATTRAHAASLQRYHTLRKRALGLDRYRLYDIQVPIVDAERTYSYDEAKAWVEASVAPLGEAPIGEIDRARDQALAQLLDLAGPEEEARFG